MDAASAKQPLLVVLEDMQWGDRPSLECIDNALRTEPVAAALADSATPPAPAVSASAYGLAESLEIADAEVGSPHDHALIEEHLIACQAIDAMKASLLGRIL